MNKNELDTLTRRGKLGVLTVPEQMLLAAAFDEYRGHAHRLERAVHDLVKEMENASL